LDIANASVAMPDKNLLEARIVKCSMRFLVGWSVAILLNVLFIGTSALYAQILPTDTWQGPTVTPAGTDSSWFTDLNWTAPGVEGPDHFPPTATQNAAVDNGTTAQVGVSAISANAAALTVGATTGGSTVQVLPGATLTLGSVTVGAQGTLRFSGGFIAVPAFQNNGLMLIDGSATQTFNVPITGSGRLLMADTTTLTLGLNGSNNTYSGGTLISAGTLLAGSTTGLSRNSAFTVNSTLDLNGFSNTIGSLAGTGIVLNNGPALATLTVGNDNTSTTFSGIIENGTSVLGLTKSGTGTLTLTRNNTYAGGTTIGAGTLQLGNGGSTGSIAGNVLDNGVLAFDRSDSVIFGGVISGTGSVTQTGTGTTILTGNNTYTGGTTISAGTLQLGNGGSTGSIAGNVLDNGVLAFNRSGSLTFGGVISGAGSVNQIGAGTTILIGNNSYTGGTTISAGTLQLGNGGSTGSITGNVIDNSVLTFDRSDSVAFTGSTSGTGSVIQTGTGTTILTGNNTYTGGTTISAGTLQLGNGGTTGSIADNVLDNGVLAFNRSDSVTFAGSISGAGSVNQTGTGTTILTGNNTYIGGTTISAGTLQLGNGGTTGSITGDVLDNGVLAFNRSDSVTFGGVISGIGSVTQKGTGTTILTGNSTYAGGTTISAGALQLGNGGTTGSIAGNVLDNGVLVFNRSDSVTFGGVISGTGRLIQQGTGVLTLPGANSYTGTTTVNSGTLIVDGSIASRQTFVNAGGLLGGQGTIGGDLINNGIVGQLNSPGTLTVTGNYIQTAGGTLRIGVGGLAIGQHDLLAVNGHVTLGGTLQIVSLGGFSLQPGNQLVFIIANNGVSGTFATVVTGTIVQGIVISLPNAVLLEGKQGSFVTIPRLTPNQLAVAKMLDSAAGDPRAAALFAFLNSQPLANLSHDLALIAPTGMTSINATAVSLGNVQISNLEQRLANVRGGSTGFSSAGFAISGGAASFGEGFAGVSGPEGKSGPPVFAPTPGNRWGVFLTGLGEFTNVDSTSNAPGYDVNTGGFTLGVDYRVTPNFAIGLTAGYAHTSLGLNSPGGNIDVNAGKIGMYATVFGNGFYLDTAVSGGPSGYTTRRTALQGTANGSTDGGDLDVLVAVGYDWKKGNLTIGPTASFQYGYVGLNSFTETGSLAPMKFPDQNTESERTAFGAKASYEWKIGHITAIPEVSVAWQHEFGDTAYSVVASLASGAGNSFTVLGPPIGRDSVLVGAGATFILNERVSTYIYYDGEFARTNYLSNNVSGGVRISF
jgi:autotransporter-associated beta strand protein